MSDERIWGGEPQETGGTAGGTAYTRPGNASSEALRQEIPGSENTEDSSVRTEIPEEQAEESENVTYHYKYTRSEARWTAEPETPKYEHYQIHQSTQEPESGALEQESEAVKRERPWKRQSSSERSFGRKAGATVALAVIFGLVAGVVFQGVELLSDRYLKNDIQVGTTQTVPDSTVALTDTETNESIAETVGQKGAVAAVAEATMPSVVAITSVSMQEIQSFFGYGMEYPSTGSGSGIIVGENDDELLIATNNHVVEGATTLTVCFIGDDVLSAEQETQSYASGDGDIDIENAVSAKIKGTDDENDLAVIAVNKADIPAETMQEIKIVQIGSSDDLVVGEQVVAIGNALGYGQSVTSGWVSALNRTITLDNGSESEMIQTDAAINPGNSGGALLNMTGELIGINCAKYASDTVEGTGYAIPISKAQPILEELMSRQTRDKVENEADAGYLGVNVTDLSSEAIQMYNMPSGAFVIEVIEGEAAAQAGLQRNDIIVQLDGQKISGKSDLIDKLQYYMSGENIEIVVARSDNGEYREQTLEVVLGNRPSSVN